MYNGSKKSGNNNNNKDCCNWNNLIRYIDTINIQIKAILLAFCRINYN